MRKQIITIAWIISISALTAFTITAQTLLANQNDEVKSKRYNFAPQIISVTDNLAELNFTPD